MIKQLKKQLSEMEEKVRPRDTLDYVLFNVTFSDGSKRQMTGRDLFFYAILRDIEVARRGSEPGAVFEDEQEIMLPYTDYEIFRGQWSDLPRGIVRGQIKSSKGK